MVQTIQIPSRYHQWDKLPYEIRSQRCFMNNKHTRSNNCVRARLLIRENLLCVLLPRRLNQDSPQDHVLNYILTNAAQWNMHVANPLSHEKCKEYSTCKTSSHTFDNLRDQPEQDDTLKKTKTWFKFRWLCHDTSLAFSSDNMYRKHPHAKLQYTLHVFCFCFFFFPTFCLFSVFVPHIHILSNKKSKPRLNGKKIGIWHDSCKVNSCNCLTWTKLTVNFSADCNKLWKPVLFISPWKNWNFHRLSTLLCGMTFDAPKDCSNSTSASNTSFRLSADADFKRTSAEPKTSAHWRTFFLRIVMTSAFLAAAETWFFAIDVPQTSSFQGTLSGLVAQLPVQLYRVCTERTHLWLIVREGIADQNDTLRGMMSPHHPNQFLWDVKQLRRHDLTFFVN